MDTTYKYPYRNDNSSTNITEIDVRAIGSAQGEPEMFILTRRSGPAISEDAAHDVTKGTATAMKLHNAQLAVYTENETGKFTKQPTEVYTEHRNIEVRKSGSPEHDISREEVEKHATQVKEQGQEWESFSHSRDPTNKR